MSIFKDPSIKTDEDIRRMCRDALKPENTVTADDAADELAEALVRALCDGPSPATDEEATS